MPDYNYRFLKLKTPKIFTTHLHEFVLTKVILRVWSILIYFIFFEKGNLLLYVGRMYVE